MSWERAMSLLPDASEALGAKMELLSNQQAQTLREQVSRRFSDGTSGGVTSKNLVNCARLSRNESWTLISAYRFSGSVILSTNFRVGLPIPLRFIIFQVHS